MAGKNHVPPGRRRYKMPLQNVASLDGGGAGAGAEMREKFGEFLRIGDGREARAGRADKGLRFFRMGRRQHFPQSAGASEARSKNPPSSLSANLSRTTRTARSARSK